MVKQNLFTTHLTSALVEKDVEGIYRELLKMGIPDAVINSPYGGDGMLTSKANNLIMLMEFKFDYDFQSRNDIVKVLIQAIYYLKKTELAGERLPSIVFVGDRNECFVVHVNNIHKYLDANIDWTIAPSSASEKNPQLKLDLYNDTSVNPYVFDVDATFDFSEVINKVLDLNSNVVRLVRITEKNIDKIFTYFCDKVIPNSKLETNALVGLFINTLTNPTENYIHPKKKNTLITPNGDVTVKGTQFLSFFSHFERQYKPSEREQLISACDRLLADQKRRMDGAFFTPTDWVDEAHKMMAEKFGADWKDEYVVWDCACGTGNLTRDYKFNELYCSTLNGEEIDMMKQNDISSEGTRFQYDFLDVLLDEDELPKGLIEAFEQNKKIIFLINPPYGTAKSMSTEEGNSKEGIAITTVNGIMTDEQIGACSQNLYAQFLFKITKIKEHYGLTDTHIGLFSPSLYLTGSTYKKFRKHFFNNFELNYGMLFQASHFADVSSQWGILFSIWNSGQQIKSEFEIELKDDVDEEVF